MSVQSPEQPSIRLQSDSNVRSRVGLANSISTMRRRLLARVGVEETTSGYRIALLRSTGAVGNLVCIGAMTIYVLLFLIALGRFSLLSPWGTVDEQLLLYNAARNFNTYGFMNSLFLHDMSTSSNPVHHPYVYIHEPPGPDVFIALLTRMVGERYGLVRVALALLFCLGMISYFRFSRLLLAPFGCPGVNAAALLFLPPLAVLHTIDHPTFSPFLLFAFHPPLRLIRYYETGRRSQLFLAVGTVLIASVYLLYQHVLMLLTAWTILGYGGLVQAKRRELAMMWGAAVFGVGLHAGQNMMFLEPASFLKEVSMSLLNRMTGLPTHDQMAEFFRSIHVVHFGRHEFDLMSVLGALNEALRFPGRRWVLLLLLASVALVVARRSSLSGSTLIVSLSEEDRVALRTVGIVGVSTAVAVLLPVLLFPAYSSEYSLQYANEFLLAIAAASVVAFGLRVLVMAIAGGRQSQHRVALVIITSSVVAIASVAVVGLRVQEQRSLLQNAVHEAQEANRYALLLGIERTSLGKVAMTNSDAVIAGFFTRESAFGACEDAAVVAGEDLEPWRCFTIHLRNDGRRLTLKPDRFVFSRTLLPGYSKCRGECLQELYERLASRYPILEENSLYTVFDVGRSMAASPN